MNRRGKTSQEVEPSDSVFGVQAPPQFISPSSQGLPHPTLSQQSRMSSWEKCPEVGSLGHWGAHTAWLMQEAALAFFPGGVKGQSPPVKLTFLLEKSALLMKSDKCLSQARKGF